MDPISALSSPYIYSHIDGAAGDETVEMAFVQAAAPDSDDWEAAAWSATTAKGAWARILIGPESAALTLTAGAWQMWVRVTGDVEKPVLHAGEIVIT